jgi:hypothetical protein
VCSSDLNFIEYTAAATAGAGTKTINGTVSFGTGVGYNPGGSLPTKTITLGANYTVAAASTLTVPKGAEVYIASLALAGVDSALVLTTGSASNDDNAGGKVYFVSTTDNAGIVADEDYIATPLIATGPAAFESSQAGAFAAGATVQTSIAAGDSSSKGVKIQGYGTGISTISAAATFTDGS